MSERRRNPNAYATMLGRVLDAVCDDRGLPSGTLGRRVVNLVTKESLAPIADAIGLRNVGAHADAGCLEPEDIPILGAVCRYVLDHIYIVPELSRMAKQHEQIRRDAKSSRP